VNEDIGSAGIDFGFGFGVNESPNFRDENEKLAIEAPVVPGGMRPRKMGLNWFMPALAKSSVGSSWGTTGLAAQKV
jgi:hypothetical protein